MSYWTCSTSLFGYVLSLGTKASTRASSYPISLARSDSAAALFIRFPLVSLSLERCSFPFNVYFILKDHDKVDFGVLLWGVSKNTKVTTKTGKLKRV